MKLEVINSKGVFYKTRWLENQKLSYNVYVWSRIQPPAKRWDFNIFEVEKLGSGRICRNIVKTPAPVFKSFSLSNFTFNS